MHQFSCSDVFVLMINASRPLMSKCMRWINLSFSILMFNDLCLDLLMSNCLMVTEADNDVHVEDLSPVDVPIGCHDRGCE